MTYFNSKLGSEHIEMNNTQMAFIKLNMKSIGEFSFSKLRVFRGLLTMHVVHNA